METVESVLQPVPEVKPLPFSYVRTDDATQAQYTEWRVSPISFVDEENKPRTDDEIIEMIKREREGRDWFTSEYWRKKGVPEEQVEFEINGRQITVYNFNKEKSFTDEHAKKTLGVFQQLAVSFPELLDRVRWVLIDNVQQASAFGDPEKYPLNGYAMRDWKAFRLLPRGTELMPHRLQATSNFEGTIVHELTHLIQSDFEEEWGEKFKWQWCNDYPDDWEVRPTPDGRERRFFNKSTGEMSPQGQFPLQPDQCITYYAKQNAREDICDSMVAYIYDPDLLRQVSQDKLSVFERHDAKQPQPTIASHRVPKEEIRLPEIKDETVLYYIKEPETTRKS